MVALCKATLQTLLETDGQLFAENMTWDVPCLGQMGSGSWEERLDQKVAFLTLGAMEQRQMTSSHAGAQAAPMRARGVRCWEAMVGSTGEKMLQERFHRGAIAPGQEMSFGKVRQGRVKEKHGAGLPRDRPVEVSPKNLDFPMYHYLVGITLVSLPLLCWVPPVQDTH